MKLLASEKLQAILVTKTENVRYFTGFVGSFGQAVITKNKTYLITDARYKLQTKKLCYKNVDIQIIEDYQEILNKISSKHRIKSIGIEDTDLTYSKFLKLKKYFKGIKLKPLGQKLDHLRKIKTKEEIKLIQKSQQINEKTLKQALKLLKPGVTEKELAWKIVDIGHQLGAEDVSFYPIVAFGKNSASPHYTPADAKYKKSDNVLIDMGFKYQGYCSDMTRTFLPKKANKEMLKVYSTVLEAQKNCIQNLKPGIKGSQGDKYSRTVINEAGFGANFTHANGHGVGLEIHEAPSLSFKTKHKDRTMKLENNMVVTVEPGIYLENKFGIRIEDMVVIQPNKCKNLTKFPKDIKSITLN